MLQAAQHGSLFASKARKETRRCPKAALNAEEGDLSEHNIQALSPDELLAKHGG
jgi:hypothetical protein